MSAIVWLLGFILVFLILVPDYYYLLKIFRVLKVLTAISFLLPVLTILWLFTIDPRQVGDAAYIPDIFVAMLVLSIACIGSLASAWLVGYVYWLSAKKTSLFEISSFHLAIMLVAAIAGWIATGYFVPLMLFGSRY